ncbi:hypothetical protein [Chitinophaga alhagiae]|uniref:hypothetical protein n=1 Tax=Chitinophaga alhagiae TaxID=2203219 RepID=UPI000E5C3AC0|nr:hypothetical protein [Chitinophaga alhagiae]
MKMIWALAAVIFFFPGCKKGEKPSEPQAALVGYWKGVFARDSGSKIDGLYILFRTGGTVRIYDMNLETDTAATSGVSRWESTYSTSGKTVVIKGVVYTFTGQINDGFYKIEGTFEDKFLNTGTFSVTR